MRDLLRFCRGRYRFPSIRDWIYILLLLLFISFQSQREKKFDVWKCRLPENTKNYYSASKRLMRERFVHTRLFQHRVFSFFIRLVEKLISFCIYFWAAVSVHALRLSHTNSRRNIYRTYAFTRKSRSADEPTLTQCEMKNKFMKNETIFLHSLNSRVSARLFHYIFAQCSDS